jgi:hypothetical protein
MVTVTYDRTVWMISVLVQGTEDETHAAQEAIEKALCPDPDHPGYCLDALDNSRHSVR